MAAVDANCEYLGIKRLQLMENAGAAVANAIKKRFKKAKVLVFAGLGNNGGDAFVASRHLKDFEVEVFLLGREKDIKTQEARHNWDALKKSIIYLKEITDSSGLDKSFIEGADVIIDGIFGTGIKGRIREPESTAINLINASKAFKVSVDVPSGLDPDGGAFEKSVCADLTLTFHRMKPGLLAPAGKEYAGEIEVVDIGIPMEAELFVGPGDIKPFLYRSPDSHKGDAGRVLVVGGGAYSGAPALAALGALRSGADIVTVAAPRGVAQIIASFSPNLIVRSLSGDLLCGDDLPLIQELINRHDVVVLGMGLGTASKTLRTVPKVVSLCKKAVVDADALNALEFPLPGGVDMVVTPHAGEFKRLSGLDLPGDWEERGPHVKDFSRQNRVVVLLKGRFDIISDGEDVRVNRTGNPGMTVGGTGDVLAGITGALFAKHRAFEAASAAAFINGTAGDLAFQDYGYGLLATDVIDNIARVMR